MHLLQQLSITSIIFKVNLKVNFIYIAHFKQFKLLCNSTDSSAKHLQTLRINRRYKKTDLRKKEENDKQHLKTQPEETNK